jgi:phage N-6-adenine-methyltransferase
MKHVAAFMSEREDWATPQAFFDAMDERFGFTLDACAHELNAKCPTYYTEADDALTQPWDGVVWCNPPYSRHIGRWVRKAYTESQQGSVVVMLIPARTDTAWWHNYVMKASEIVLVQGRLRFDNSADSAPFPSAVIIFDPTDTHDTPLFTTMPNINDDRRDGAMERRESTGRGQLPLEQLA